jgi:signal transduction histidine kinase
LIQPRSDAGTKPSGLSIRVRLVVVAFVVVALVLGISGAGVIYWQHRSMLQQRQTRLNSESASVALAVSQGRPFTSLVTPGTGVQIVSSSGQVVAASEAIEGRAPISDVHPKLGGRQEIKVVSGPQFGDDGIVLANAETVTTGRGNYTIYTMAFGSHLASSTRTLIIELSIGLPVLLILFGVLIWIFVGVVLRPIERMRTTVSELAEDELDLRVPVPPGDDEIARLASTLNEMLDRLEMAQRRQRGFIADASHELRSPIASLLATVEVARAHPDRTNWKAVSDVVVAEGRRLSQLVDDLLMLAAADERRDRAPWRAVDLEELLFAEADRLRLQTSLVVETDQVSPVRVQGDLAQLDRAIRNVVDNAARHAAQRLRFSIQTQGAEVHLCVEDDGPGVDPADAERLFERFSRADLARDRPSGGAGLGLAIVASVMAAHGGSARFVPVAQGAKLELVLPVSQQPLRRPSAAEDEAGPELGSDPLPH